jgi:exodeoxyribonuclease VIII
MQAALVLPPKKSKTKTKRITFAEYMEDPSIHATGLKQLAKSPAHYAAFIASEKAETDHLRVGRASHTAVLEPQQFLADYVLWTGGIRRGKDWEAFEAAAGKRTILTQEQYATSLKIGEAVRSHRVASKYLKERGQAEASINWVHQSSGLKCKARLDWLCSVLVDLKTTNDPSPSRFASDAARFGYPLQLAFYKDGVKAALGLDLPTKIIAVQSKEPFDVVVYDVPAEVISFGRSIYEDAIRKFVDCSASGEWPGIAPDNEVTLQLPAWATSVDEEIALTMNGENIF